ncbi:MAG: TIGR00645 family protein, partial [Rhodospirillales bacterium]|nr:TIGR00645 family protein [Rhodospirillales bacterium]
MNPAIRILEAIIFGGRWLIVPIYLSLLFLLGVLVVYFVGEIVHVIPMIGTMSETALLLFAL